jgi:hypothetical protein
MNHTNRRLWWGAAHVLAAATVVAWTVRQPAAARVAQTDTPGRIVAVGDVHGAADNFVIILQRAGLIDAGRSWIGGRTTLVQTGDVTDRGTGVRAALDLLMTLEDRAPRGGGRVVALMGNHEAMNLLGDLHDVTPEIYATFADERSESRRARAYDTYVSTCRTQAAAAPAGVPGCQPATRDAWLATHPPGFVEYREAFGPGGRYGRWLRNRPAIAKIGGTLFLHGGLAPEVSESVDALNARLRREIRSFDEAQRGLVERRLIPPFATLKETLQAVQVELARLVAQAQAPRDTAEPSPIDPAWAAALQAILKIESWIGIDPEGPLWFRGYASWPSETGDAQIAAVLEKHDAARIVVGHTVPESRRITSRFGARAFLIDTGMLSSFFKGGQASALEIRGDSVKAIYAQEEEALR